MSDTTSKPADGGPAFPVPDYYSWARGLSLREYAAIKLRVPNSGVDWLDDMIRSSMLDELAAKAMAGMIATDRGWSEDEHQEQPGLTAYGIADAMLKARG